MSSLRDVIDVHDKTVSIKSWALERQLPLPLSIRQLLKSYAPVWGFADLHAHPTSHMAFGADKKGDNGIIWGKPMVVDPVTRARQLPQDDLCACDGTQHSFFGFDISKGVDIDPVKKFHRTLIMYNIENDNLTHNTGGSPGFDYWPSSENISHQQMHISWIHRAWRGGLRLIIASVTDNQLLSTWWNRGIDLEPFKLDPKFDLNSAKLQLTAIHDIVKENSSWMSIVKTAAKARDTIKDGRLAVILGVGMDALTSEQIIELKRDYDVRQVVPIHLANNSFGGVAVYSDSFNTNNWYINGGQPIMYGGNPQLDLFFKVLTSPEIGFKLKKPMYLSAISSLIDYADLITALNVIYGTAVFVQSSIIPMIIPPGIIPQIFPPPNFIAGAIIPLPVADDLYAELNYESTSGGHQNQVGLRHYFRGPRLLDLMREGLMIDLSHMSSLSIDDALKLSEEHSYPMMNSHTGMRLNGVSYIKYIPIHHLDTGDNKIAVSERDISANQVEKLAKFGGILGVGTAGFRQDPHNQLIGNADQMASWIDMYLSIKRVMKGRGVALGTDMNGMSPQIKPNPSRPFDYPFMIGNPIDSSEYLGHCTTGDKTFDFQRDGLAHYGMLPDFVQALRQCEGGGDVADGLFRTAEDTIRMWEKVELAAKRC